ncbi:MAG: hypothetical protein ACI87N_000786, partial [Flavobacteriales bacterium]
MLTFAVDEKKTTRNKYLLSDDRIVLNTVSIAPYL